MITCQECKERMLPQDPSKPYYVGFNTRSKGVSPYSGCLLPLCNSCSNYPGIWGESEIPTFLQGPPEPTAQVDTITQLRGQVKYLQNKLEEHLMKSKKTYVIK